MLSGIVDNEILVIAASTWVITQILKVIVILVQERRLAWNFFFTSGGMPSAHTATVCALCTAIAMKEGTGTVFFAIAVVLAVIVMYEAAGVRQSVGQQSAILNRIVKEVKFKTSKMEREKDLREFIGHTPFQVFVGALLGIFISWTWVILSTH